MTAIENANDIFDFCIRFVSWEDKSKIPDLAKFSASKIVKEIISNIVMNENIGDETIKRIEYWKQVNEEIFKIKIL